MPQFPTFPTFLSLPHHATPYPAISPYLASLSAAGKHILVTGGAKGIGLSIATSFAAAGARAITILGRNAQDLEAASATIVAEQENPGDNAQGVGPRTQVGTQLVDLLDTAATETAFARAVQQFGTIDVLVANAGVESGVGSVSECGSGADIAEAAGKNIGIVFNTLRAWGQVRGGNEKKAGGVVIVVSTRMVHMQPPVAPQYMGYAVGKAAAHKVAEYFALQYPDSHFVYLQPGLCATQLNGFRFGVDDIRLPGHFAVWLASDEARFLRNRFVWSNWNVEGLVKKREEILGSRMLTWDLIGLEYPTPF